MKRLFTNLLRSKIRRHRAKSRTFARTFEVLEVRQMMTVNSASILADPIALFPASFNTPAATLMAGINDDILYIRGTDAADTITLRQQNNAIKIDGLAGSFNTSFFRTSLCGPFGGNDKINLKSEAVKGQQAITKATEIWSGVGQRSDYRRQRQRRHLRRGWHRQSLGQLRRRHHRRRRRRR